MGDYTTQGQDMPIGEHNAKKTHCIHGHKYTDDNTYITKAGSRQCMSCTRRWAKERYQRRLKGTLPIRPKSQDLALPMGISVASTSGQGTISFS